MHSDQVPFVTVIPLGSPSADDSLLNGAYFYAHRKCVITNVAVVNSSNISASNTDYVQLELKNGSDVIAEIDTRAAHENGLSANVAKELNVSETLAEVAQGDTLTVNYNETDAGSNVALTSGALIVTGYWKQLDG
jgi:hypothetical protein